jgi:hypothetical protein
VAAFALLCGLASGLTVAGVGAATAEEPEQPKSKNTLDKKQADPNPVVPADGRRAKAPARLAMPNPDRAIFGKIQDFTDVKSEAENPDEYWSWYEFVVHAKQFTAPELEQAGFRGLTVIDLLKPNREYFRTELLRFDGKLICVRRLPAPKSFTDNPNTDVKELYEARFVPLDDSPLNPVSIVFLELPKEFAAVKDKPYGEWVDYDSWASAAGYFFKTMSVPGEPGKTVGVPLLVGKSITPHGDKLPTLGEDPTALEPKVLVYDSIRDDSKMVGDDTGWEEIAAFSRVIMHAHRFTPEELEKHAIPDLKFADLFEEGRKVYKLKNVKFEGRLISLRVVRVGPELGAAGVNTLYQGWLVPRDEPRGNPICVHFTQPLEGVEPDKPGSRVNKWVSFAGYSFKLMRYESAEQWEDGKHKGTYKVKRAPMLVGKGLIPRRDPDGPDQLSWGYFMQGAIVGSVLLIAAGGLLTWWYRSGDRKARKAAETVRGGNPFDPNAAPPAPGP